MIQLQNITKTYGAKTVLDDITMSFPASLKGALVGPNGSGKTTLMRLIMSLDLPDAGSVYRDGDIAYVAQSPTFGETIAASFPADTADWERDIALALVGLERVHLDSRTSHLSGGQKTRLAISIALVRNNNPSILLLDEPTNNLDSNAIAWLTTFIKKFKGSVLITSHDRDFINATCTTIYELQDGHITTYPGSYDEYKAAKDAEFESVVNEYEQHVQRRNSLKRQLQQKQTTMHKVSSEKYDKNKHESKMEWRRQSDMSQQTAGKQIRALKTKVESHGIFEKPRAESIRKVTISGAPRHKLMVCAEHIGMRFAKSAQPVFADVSFELRGNERLQIIGSNGSGKTTLLRAILGEITLTDGSLYVSSAIKIGYISQEVTGLDHTRTVLENLLMTDVDRTNTYTVMRHIGLSESGAQHLYQLSRGQQAKLSFAKLLLSGLDLLILDEPTNHVDIATKEVIEDAVNRFAGGIIFVTHDAYFARRLRPSRVVTLD